jgi:hypothetical protein
MTDPKKCAHPACRCIAPEGKKFCSQMCEDAKNVTALTCHCAHSACQELGS